MPAHKSRWTDQYGPVRTVSYRLPERVKDIIDTAATEHGITATDAVIEAVLLAYTETTRAQLERKR